MLVFVDGGGIVSWGSASTEASCAGLRHFLNFCITELLIVVLLILGSCVEEVLVRENGEVMVSLVVLKSRLNKLASVNLLEPA